MTAWVLSTHLRRGRWAENSPLFGSTWLDERKLPKLWEVPFTQELCRKLLIASSAEIKEES
jgi:hypothetical protein